MKTHACCFIGHRKIDDTPELRERLRGLLSELMQNGTVDFLFGDHSAFGDLCYSLVTELKEKHPAIRRVRFRRDYEEPDDYTMPFLLAGYEESVCPKGVGSAGRASYVESNRAMIRASDLCVFYYDETYRPERTQNYPTADLPKSGTALAYRYAVSQKKRIINCFCPAATDGADQPGQTNF